MNIRTAAATLCLVTLVACSEQKDESAWTPSSVTQSGVAQLEEDTDGHSDTVVKGLGPEIEDYVSDTRADISDRLEPSALNDYESEKVDTSEAPNMRVIDVKAIVKTKTEEKETSATYIIKRGDTLGAIANLHNVTVNAIVANNNLTDRDSIRIGQQLVIE